MKNPNAKKESTIEAMWREVTTIWGSSPNPHFMSSKIDWPVPFLGTRKQISFRRPHPMEDHMEPDHEDMNQHDWTREHD